MRVPFVWRFVGLRRRYAINRSWGDGVAQAAYWGFRGKCFGELLTADMLDADERNWVSISEDELLTLLNMEVDK